MQLIIAISAGDLAGIGLEVIFKALNCSTLNNNVRFVVVGNTYHLLKAFQAYSIFKEDSIEIQDSFEPSNKRITLLDITDNTDLSSIIHGEVSEISGYWSFKFLEYATDLVISGQAHALVTAPINKTSWKLAGIEYPGHTEALAKKTNTRNYAMCFYSEQLKILLETIHIPLSKVAQTINKPSILRKLELANAFLMALGIANPKIAVAGLNPHSGENGHIGDEELRIIAPTIKLARNKGLNVVGPLPADTLFYQAWQEKMYDLIVCMYHDQGLIPLKMLAMNSAVNTTLGLPLIRTSPDHGTAFDIAGKGVANEGSMLEAIRLAVRLVSSGRNW